MSKCLLDSVNSYKQLCDEMMVKYSDIIDICDNKDLLPGTALLRIRDCCKVMIQFYETKYDDFEEQADIQKTQDKSNIVPINAASGSRH